MKKISVLVVLLFVVGNVRGEGTLPADIPIWEACLGGMVGTDEGANKPEGVEIYDSVSGFMFLGWNPLRWVSRHGDVSRKLVTGPCLMGTYWQGQLTEPLGLVNELTVVSAKGVLGWQLYYQVERPGRRQFGGLKLAVTYEDVSGDCSGDGWDCHFSDQRWGTRLEGAYVVKTYKRLWLPELRLALGGEHSFAKEGGDTWQAELHGGIRYWSYRCGSVTIGLQGALVGQHHWNQVTEQNGKHYVAPGLEGFVDWRKGYSIFARIEARYGRELDGEPAVLIGIALRR